MLMSKAVRKALRDYNKDLLRRVRKVPCPRCGAKKNEKCIGQYKRPIKHCHFARHDEAKLAGYVKCSKGGRP